MESASASPPFHPPAETGVRVRELRVSYRRGFRRRPALQGVSFRADRGTVTAVLGPNGAGKTTLFRVLLGFLRPDAGAVTVDGIPPRRHRRLRGTGYLPERGSLPGGWSVDGFLRRGLRLAGVRTPYLPATLARLRDRAGLADRGSAPLESLSLGLGRKTLLAFALLGEPGLLLLDEPLSGLDPHGRADLLRRIRRLGGRGATVLMASHDLDAVAGVADRAVLLQDGRAVRTLEGLRRDPLAGSRLRAHFDDPVVQP